MKRGILFLLALALVACVGGTQEIIYRDQATLSHGIGGKGALYHGDHTKAALYHGDGGLTWRRYTRLTH